jgi:putative acetyltransferase
MSALQFRRSRRSDAGTVFNLTKAAVARLAPEPYPPEVVETWMTGRVPEDYAADCAAGAIWIAELGGRAAGYAHAVPGEIIRLFVDARCQGAGAGAALMRLALQDAIPEGGGTVRIEATLNAVPFYRRWGFRERGRGVFSGREGLPPIAVVHLQAGFEADALI